MTGADVPMICLRNRGRGAKAVTAVTEVMHLLHSLSRPRARERGQRPLRVLEISIGSRHLRQGTYSLFT
jgi:hypothetical protein